MSRARNTKPKNKQKRKEQKMSSLPKVTNTYWRWQNYTWAAFQLPTGVKVMSARKMALLVDQPKQKVREFITSNQLETMTVEVPNGISTQVYPLKVGAVYLHELLSGGYIPKNLPLSPYEWAEIASALTNPEQGNSVTLNPCYFTGEYRVLIAESYQIELEGNIKLEVLVDSTGEYRIAHHEGLKCIKSTPDWLIQNSQRKAKTFSTLDLSKDNVECRVQTQGGVKSVYALTLQEWLSIWVHFANNKNQEATKVLKAFALKNIQARIASNGSQN
ncbi:hypothetical protein DSM106972_067270 [Dulcicalothrix desertica PCC 7102]|uniref:Uncharacterized protein n=1 Tax=Dulcicalothrix desertica PCC 7102 TaxID=232991 RepID=A0A433V6B0_9CYAN|nr:hypothetical protein [Dulcicalothrix desertica]RUT01630.1 hypothetical protein DSM106972_067270 [Dulcicalothrix desertica PCC 7102]